MINIEVKDRNKFILNYDNGELIEPNDLKNKFEELINKYENCKILMIPSILENCLRIYVESKSKENNEEIINIILKYLKDVNYC